MVDLISGGIAFAICFKFIAFVFLEGFSFKELTCSKSNKLNFREYCSYIFALAALYVGLLSLTVYFTLILGTGFVRFDGFLFSQIQHILIVGIVFFLLKNYLAYNKNMSLFDPNILYLNIGKRIYTYFINKLQWFSMVFIRKLTFLICNMQSSILLWFESKTMLTKGIGWGIAVAIVLFLIALSPLK